MPGGYLQVGDHDYAHRRALEHKLGRPIRPGFNALHTCDNPPCVNEDHLWEGTQAENLADMVAKGRSNKGTKHWASKLTPEQVEAIRSDPRPSAQIAKDYPVGRRQISRIRQGVRW